VGACHCIHRAAGVLYYWMDQEKRRPAALIRIDTFLVIKKKNLAQCDK
jgi:hypothetical protein